MRPLPLSATRRAVLSLFDEPSNDPYVCLTIDVNTEPMMAFQEAFAREHGTPVGIQHLVTKAVAKCLVELPAINVTIIKGRIFALETVNIAVPVHLGGDGRRDETSIFIVKDVDKKTLLEIVRETHGGAAAERGGTSGMALVRRLGRHIPVPAMRAAMGMMGSAMGTKPVAMAYRERIGASTVVTNLGPVLKVPEGARFRAASATLFARIGHVASGFALAPAQDAPVVEGGKVVVRHVLPIVLILDHRAIDGFLMGKLSLKLAETLLAPATLAVP